MAVGSADSKISGADKCETVVVGQAGEFTAAAFSSSFEFGDERSCRVAASGDEQSARTTGQVALGGDGEPVGCQAATVADTESDLVHALGGENASADSTNTPVLTGQALINL